MKSLFIILTFLGMQAYGQEDVLAVKKTISDLFLGMKQSDTGLVRSAFSENAQLQTVLKNREGQTIVRTEPLDSFLLSLSRPHEQVYDERISFDQVKIDGDMASVWAPYKFYLGKNFSHCGVDSFQLARINGVWKIIYLVDTRRRTGCSED